MSQSLSLKFNKQDGYLKSEESVRTQNTMPGNQATTKKLGDLGSKKSSSLILPTTSLASAESLSMPQVQEIVLSADLQCAECKKKVYDVLSRATGVESMVVDITKKKVILICKSEMKESTSKIVTINRTPYLKFFKNFFDMTKS